MESQPRTDLKSAAQHLKDKNCVIGSETGQQGLKSLTPAKSRSLLDLPPEIRLKIYPYVFQSDHTAKLTLRSSHLPERPGPTSSGNCNTQNPVKQQEFVAIPFTSQSNDLVWKWNKRKDTRTLRVCKLIYAEAAEILYKDAKFIWPNVSYPPDRANTLQRSLRSPLYQFIRHVQTELTVRVDKLVWTADTGPFYSRCVQWQQSLPRLKKVDVVFKFVTRKRCVLDDKRLCIAAKFVQKLMLQRSNVERLPIRDQDDHDNHFHHQKMKDYYRRVLHIARETLVITRKMSGKGMDLDSTNEEDGDLTVPKIPVPAAILRLPK